jgi:hypothetical protein
MNRLSYLPIAALMACGVQDPDVSDTQQEMRMQDGETIEVESCRPGFYWIGQSCQLDPSLERSGDGWQPPVVYGDRGGGGGGGGGDFYFEYGSDTHDVFVVSVTWRGQLCQMWCAITSNIICAAVAVTCPVASVVTIGGLAIPCSAALIAACGSTAGAQVVCTNSCPP